MEISLTIAHRNLCKTLKATRAGDSRPMVLRSIKFDTSRIYREPKVLLAVMQTKRSIKLHQFIPKAEH
jgi:hypothetical protein